MMSIQALKAFSIFGCISAVLIALFLAQPKKSPVTGNITVDNGGAHTQTVLLSGDDEARLLRAANRMLAEGDTLAADALKSVAFVKFYTFVHEQSDNHK